MYISLSNSTEMLTMMRGWTLLILEVRGQRSRSQWTYMEISLWKCWRQTVLYFFIKLCMNVNHGVRMDPTDFGGQRSKVKVTVDTYGKIPVNPIQTKPLCASSTNLADMLAIVNSIDFGGHSSKVKVTIDIIDKCWVRGGSTLCLLYFSLLCV